MKKVISKDWVLDTCIKIRYWTRILVLHGHGNEFYLAMWALGSNSHVLGWDTKGAFFSESEIRFSNFPISQKNYSKKLSWAWNLNKLFTDMGGNFQFQAQDSFLEYFFWKIGKFEKRISLSEKKPLLELATLWYLQWLLSSDE